jgi:16S rRNA (adenine1518-N6/adenine1519-N6)-dimethyltransferase
MSHFNNNIHQKKSLGQVFLKETWPCIKLVDLLANKGVRSTIEIGPGAGILTREILNQGIDVCAIEKDSRFAEKLASVCKVSEDLGKSSLSINNVDVLKFDLSSWLKSQPAKKAICGNIPYNISSAVMMWMLPQIKNLDIASFMVQKEFAERVAASSGTKAYGSLSVFAQLRSKVKLEYVVTRDLFTPVPRVDSAVISFVSLDHKYSDHDLKKTELLTKTAFSQRRKKMKNSIAKLTTEISEEDLGVDLSRRPDSFSPEEYIAMARIIWPEPEQQN